MTANRVCILLGGHFATAVGGAEYQAKCIVEELVRQRAYRVSYFARNIPQDLREDGYRVANIATRNRINRHAFFLDAPRLYAMLRREAPDVIYQRGLLPYTGVAALYARRSGAHLIFHAAHDDDVRQTPIARPVRNRLRAIDRRLGLYGLRHADSVVVQSAQQATQLESAFGLHAAAIMRNFHPAPPEVGTKPNEINVLWVANFKPAKRPEAFVALAERFRERPDVRFHMVGACADSRYDPLRERMGRLENLMYHGALDMEAVNGLLTRARVFVNTSESEGFPNTYIQAWQRNVPVLTLEIDPDGVLEAERIGHRTGSVEGLVRRLADLVAAPEVGEAMGRRARAYALAVHSERNFSILLDLIDRGIGDRDASGALLKTSRS